ncbi:MAG: hypothetical protein J7K72_04570 [Candidatus Aenigmarchaeota archaeon]|nr:hypothetical protein [Candidatus Aenigmarchaeota archaeon]
MKNYLPLYAALLTFILLVSVANAEVNMSVEINSTGDVNFDADINADGNVTVIINGTNIGEEVGGLEQDVYGQPQSNPKDFILEEEFGNETEEIPIAEICNDLVSKGYITDTATHIVPQEFVAYLKSLGYDDESHINYIWNLCQEMKFNSQSSYIKEHEGTWSKDDVGGGINFGDLVSVMSEAVNYLLGKTYASDVAIQIARQLDRYFASDADVYYLDKRVKELELEAEAVSRTMQKIAVDSYCQAKIDMMIEYNFTSVTCGNTTYYYWQVVHSPPQTKVVGVTPSGYQHTPLKGPNIEYEEIPSSLLNYIPGKTKPVIIDYSPKEMVRAKHTFNLYVFTNAPTRCQYDKKYFIFGEGKDFDEGQGEMVHKSVITEPEDGRYEYYIRCADRFGNIAVYSRKGHVKSVMIMDTEKPKIVCFLENDTLSYTTAESTKITCAVSDATRVTVQVRGLGDVLELKPCNGNEMEYCAVLGIDELEEGEYNLSAYAVDRAGNENYDKDFATLTVDKTSVPKEEQTEPAAGPLTGLFSSFTSNILASIINFFSGS